MEQATFSACLLWVLSPHSFVRSEGRNWGWISVRCLCFVPFIKPIQAKICFAVFQIGKGFPLGARNVTAPGPIFLSPSSNKVQVYYHVSNRTVVFCIFAKNNCAKQPVTVCIYVITYLGMRPVICTYRN